MRHADLPGGPVDVLPNSKLSAEQPFRMEFPTREWHEANPVDLQDVPVNEVYCFRDGSKTEEGTGVGFIIRAQDRQTDVSLPLRNATVYQAEVVAISNAAEWLRMEGVTDKSITIYSDSQVTLKALLSLKFWERLNNLSGNNSVTIRWIPGNSKDFALWTFGSLTHCIHDTDDLIYDLDEFYSRLIITERRSISPFRTKTFSSIADTQNSTWKTVTSYERGWWRLPAGYSHE